ncbi:50S ribosomal protein L4 [Neochlamydia sp. EPS4]|uniref:50S ribosomal protein L4 n=1 Tax=unclassified Neochlamydia TaxID=2643326 RepID=UPI000580B2DB|nr:MULTISPECIES: 50S ribosomal protein L4 [unclassified Neochlamydia]KIC72774.1 50S ribosomal protein L4 [Neochlamydia sp. EPS4]KIC76830.1 50S ribosomal protein L4 [Neochlamydia sp. TUME1]BBI17304.1 50S ribosomal protein L4 [Neochlamydia sp. S13]
MATLKKYNLKGQETGQVIVDERLANAEAHGQMIKDYIVAIRANARQWSANTKTRSEVNHSTKKPHPQKGGGRARQGMLSAPQYKGGGRVFGPRPKFDQHVRINKKERKAAIRCLLAEKIAANRLHVLTESVLNEPKTKVMADFLKVTGLANHRVMFLGEAHYAEVKTEEETKRVSIHHDQHDNFIKSVRNLPKVSFSLATNISGYDVLVAKDIVVTESALIELVEWLCP